MDWGETHAWHCCDRFFQDVSDHVSELSVERLVLLFVFLIIHSQPPEFVIYGTSPRPLEVCGNLATMTQKSEIILYAIAQHGLSALLGS